MLKTLPTPEQASQINTALARTDVVRLLQKGGSRTKVNVNGQDLHGIDLMNCPLQKANLSHARVSEANLCGAKLSQADLSSADLHGSSLCWADLQRARLCATDLRQTDLSWADLCEADLQGATLDGARLSGASLYRADLRGASLDKADVRGADFRGASFGGTSAYAQARDHLEPRGALFSNATPRKGGWRFFGTRGKYALGFSFGLLSMSAVSFLGVLGMRITLASLRMKKQVGEDAAGEGPCDRVG